MARSGLAGRLGRIREGQKNGVKEIPETRADTGADADLPSDLRGARNLSDVRSSLPGWKAIAPDLFERATVHDCPEWRAGFSEYLPLLFPRERERLSVLLEDSRFQDRLVFFDLETTGLSHGAGTVAFMASVGKFIPARNSGKAASARRLEVTQILLGDYPGEVAFLSRFVELAGDDPALVSFNGKCFDSQILANRFLMNGMRPRIMSPDTVHLDLLFPSRRLWKETLGSCRLSAIEEGILETLREDDLPGSDAPDAWFDFLSEGVTERLLKVGDHNRDDCVSLARLLFALDGEIDGATGRAALVRAIERRAARDYASSAELLAPLAESGDRTALRLLAIDAEHRLGDFGTAMECASALGDETRIARIEMKIARARTEKEPS
jgi:uncharacterized protein YprB with RNaseH-like and TPR domain